MRLVVSLLFVTACLTPPEGGPIVTPAELPPASSVLRDPVEAAAPVALAPAVASPPPQPASAVVVDPNLAAVVIAPDRSAADRELDPARHPAEMLTFFGIAAGMHVAELGSGSGYTSELLARAVGPSGVVYGQNPKWLLERFAEKPWAERLKKPAMKNVTRLDREFDDPFPADVKNLDAVISILFYHDTVWLGADRDKMNRAAFNALKSGGVYGIVDHSGRAGTGLTEVKTLHRIDEETLKAEVLRAGFRLGAEGMFLKNPSDARDWNDSPTAAADKRGMSDRFVLKFVKP
jgi:predicted methyltransferase